ncbi:MAG: glycosyltransferase [Gemmatimonadetes bacterium]|nr:glycosyltransferase [Gemmatimonadota bacterium]
MKILHLSKFYPPDKGGLEHVVARLAEGAAAAGHEVRVVSATGSSWVRPPGKRITEVPRAGVTVVRLPTHGVVWSQPIAPGYLSAVRWPADVVHVHHPHPLADLAVILNVRAPVVITHHSDVRRQTLAKPFYWPLARAVLSRARAIVVPTRAHLGASNEVRGFEEKVRVIPFGVDQVRFHPREPDRKPPVFASDGPVGLFAGRLVGYKGLDVLIRAVEGTTLTVVIVGDGPLRRSLERQVGAAGLARQIRFAGELPDDDIPAYFRSADYLVLPSTSPAEMFGIVLIEAMASGKPVISTALPTGVREVNERDVTGLEVPPGDPVALRQAMQRLAGDAGLRRRLGAAGRKRVEERFTLKQMVDDHLKLYSELISRPS